MNNDDFYNYWYTELTDTTFNPTIWKDVDGAWHYSQTRSSRKTQSCFTCLFVNKKPNVCRTCKLLNRKNKQSNYQRDTSIAFDFRHIW